jgi:hypothetical protein
VRFNDPFDVPSNICDGLNEVILHNALADRMIALVMQPELPHQAHHSLLTRMLLRMLAQASDELKKQLIAGIEAHRSDPITTSEGLELLREQWRSMYSEHRILCFTERWDSASMWDRYSDGHRGVLFEFACLDHLDSAWLMAKPVNYSDSPLQVNTAEGFVELMLYDPQYAVQRIMEEYTHTKTKDWEPEKEWRVASWKRHHEGGDFSDYEFLPQELIGITLGASISETDRADLLLMLNARYPHVEIWQATIEGGRRLTRMKRSVQ